MIAHEHNTTVDELAAANDLDNPDVIVAGTTLTIPTEATQASQSTTARTHVVEAGDSLWAIATRYSVALGALGKLNSVGADAIIYPGQVLELPTSDGAVAPHQ